MASVNTIKWLRGLASVVISSAAGGVAVVIVDPMTFNFGVGLGKLAEVCGVLALTHGAMYLSHSPLPDPDPTQPTGSAQPKG